MQQLGCYQHFYVIDWPPGLTHWQVWHAINLINMDGHLAVSIQCCSLALCLCDWLNQQYSGLHSYMHVRTCVHMSICSVYTHVRTCVHMSICSVYTHVYICTCVIHSMYTVLYVYTFPKNFTQRMHECCIWHMPVYLYACIVGGCTCNCMNRFGVLIRA